ncbi:hypothetical protein M4951_18385 [Blastopirellula sp. J2-11]|uniref:hypothetical protein n=1 Tax=Blastopirellula sp. J2-11 TaxID=2943192 RepID=UPI0021C87D5E|nr:hypothetical protein [Blastopirellula sp. J2-11]UUO05337.1 hypothetical protein M4951_18385 [Blastopirellula sp. J2-11]
MYLWAGAMIVLSWLSIALAYPLGTIGMGYFLGSLSAQVTLAAAWAALGPTSPARRMILSIGWVLSLWGAVGITMSINSGPNEIMEMVVVGVLLLVQWLLVQLPLWGLALGLNVQLRHRDDTHHDARAVELRFSLRHLFIIMSIAGLFLGIGRLVVPLIDLSGRREIPIFVFLAVAGVVMTFPLLVATLMQRMALPCALLSLMFVGGATVAELPLYQQLGGSRPAAGAFIAINTFTAIVVLSFAAAVRLNGFSLQRKPKPTDP